MMVARMSSCTSSAVERAGMTNLDEGQKVSYDVVPNPKTRKSSAERLLEKRSEPLAAVNVAPLRARKGVSLSVALMFLGSVAGSNGLTTTRAGSGRRYKLWRFTNRDCDKRHLGLFKMRLCERRWNPIWTGVSSGLSQ